MLDRRGKRAPELDRRSASRGAVRCEVEFLVCGVTYSATAENLSTRGVFVATELEVFDGLAADVSLFLEGDTPGDEVEPIKLVGSVVRVARRRDERPGFAVEFDSIDEGTRARIEQALQG